MALYLRGKRHPVWWINFWTGGKHHQVNSHFSSKREARALEAILRGIGARQATRPTADPLRTRNAVEGFLDTLYATPADRGDLREIWDAYTDAMRVKGRVIAQKSMVRKMCTLRRFVDWTSKRKITRIGAVTGIVTRDYASYLKTKPGAAGAKRRRSELSDLSSIWTLVGGRYGITLNPWTATIPPAPPPLIQRVGFTQAQVSDILCAASDINPQWRTACLVGLYTGLRYSDVCRLSWESIDLDAGVIRVKPGKTASSSGVTVLLPLAAPLFEELSRLHNAESSGRVMPWLRETGPKGERRFSTVLRRAGIDPTRYTFHSFRHTFRTALARSGTSVQVAMKMCGHTNASMSARYDHYDYLPEEREAIGRMTAFLN